MFKAIGNRLASVLAHGNTAEQIINIDRSLARIAEQQAVTPFEPTTKRKARIHAKGRKTSVFVQKRMAKGLTPSDVHGMANDKRFHLMFNPLVNGLVHKVIA